MAKYIILRDSNASLRSRDALGRTLNTPTGMGLETPGGLFIPPAPKIETADMHSAEAHAAARASDVIGIARAMPTRLIAPEPMDDLRDEDVAPTWGITATGADASPFDGSGVRVAVLDTGIDRAHPAFQGVTLTTRDFTGNGIHDANGHGTHCAGTVFGRNVNGTRIGVARGVTQALIGKVLADDGRGSSDMLFDAMRWCADQGTRVISMSLGFDFAGLSERLVQDEDYPVLLATSVALEGYRMNLRMFDQLMDMFRAQAAFDGGTVVVAAAGNESRRQIHPDFEVSTSVPAAANGIISVGALGQSDAGLNIAPFSNTNPTLAAPGVGIVSAAADGDLRSLNGTSMACPHVAGLAALWWQAIGASGIPVTSRSIEARLMASASLAGIAPDVDVADRGQGLAQAPLAAMN